MEYYLKRWNKKIIETKEVLQEMKPSEECFRKMTLVCRNLTESGRCVHPMQGEPDIEYVCDYGSCPVL